MDSTIRWKQEEDVKTVHAARSRRKKTHPKDDSKRARALENHINGLTAFWPVELKSLSVGSASGVRAFDSP